MLFPILNPGVGYMFAGSLRCQQLAVKTFAVVDYFVARYSLLLRQAKGFDELVHFEVDLSMRGEIQLPCATKKTFFQSLYAKKVLKWKKTCRLLVSLHFSGKE